MSNRRCVWHSREHICSRPKPGSGVIALTDVPLAAVEAHDATVFPAPRTAFLRAWIGSPGHVGCALVRDGGLAGWGVIRPCRKGRKIGPLVADDRATAEVVLSALLASMGGGEIFLDVPSINRDASPWRKTLGSPQCSRLRACIPVRSRGYVWSGYSASPLLSWGSGSRSAEVGSGHSLLVVAYNQPEFWLLRGAAPGQNGRFAVFGLGGGLGGACVLTQSAQLRGPTMEYLEKVRFQFLSLRHAFLRLGSGVRCYCAWIPAVRATSVQRFTSLVKKASKAAGSVAIGSTAIPAMRCLGSSSAMPFAMA
jgi:hypothetical protein